MMTGMGNISLEHYSFSEQELLAKLCHRECGDSFFLLKWAVVFLMQTRQARKEQTCISESCS